MDEKKLKVDPEKTYETPQMKVVEIVGPKVLFECSGPDGTTCTEPDD